MTPRKTRSARATKTRRPDAIERKYKRYLRGVVADFSKLVRSQLIPILPELLRDRESQVRADGWTDTIERAVSSISMASSRNTENAAREAVNIGNDIADFNRAEWGKVMVKAIGVDMTRGAPWLADELKSFANENVKLITSLPTQALDKIEGIISRGVRAGTSATVLSKQITGELGIARRRASLIARDQVATLNGQITKARQLSIGIKTYYWDTSGDERVRKSHSVLDGKLCRWDNDRVYSDDGGKTWKSRKSIGGTISAPGQDVNCRCSGLSNTDELMDSLGI